MRYRMEFVNAHTGEREEHYEKADSENKAYNLGFAWLTIMSYSLAWTVDWDSVREVSEGDCHASPC